MDVIKKFMGINTPLAVEASRSTPDQDQTCNPFETSAAHIDRREQLAHKDKYRSHLNRMPVDIHCSILDFLESPSDLASYCLTSKSLYANSYPIRAARLRDIGSAKEAFRKMLACEDRVCRDSGEVDDDEEFNSLNLLVAKNSYRLEILDFEDFVRSGETESETNFLRFRRQRQEGSGRWLHEAKSSEYLLKNAPYLRKLSFEAGASDRNVRPDASSALVNTLSEAHFAKAFPDPLHDIYLPSFWLMNAPNLRELDCSGARLDGFSLATWLCAGMTSLHSLRCVGNGYMLATEEYAFRFLRGQSQLKNLEVNIKTSQESLADFMKKGHQALQHISFPRMHVTRGLVELWRAEMKASFVGGKTLKERLDRGEIWKIARDGSWNRRFPNAIYMDLATVSDDAIGD